MWDKSKILITGGSGMIGSSLVRALQTLGADQLLTPTHQDLDLLNQKNVENYFAEFRPDYVFHIAAIVGGIAANNNFPARFLYENTQMQCNVIQAAFKNQVRKLLFPGTACTYPKFASQPIKEDAILTGMVEPTNLAYSVAKINGIVMCQSYAKQYGFKAITPLPTNAYGIGDNFDPSASHVIPALMRRFHEAKLNAYETVTLWGTGTPLREFIYVDDLADALLFLMQHYDSPNLINVGTMQEISIANLAQEIAKIVGFVGEIVMDATKPDGPPRKCLDSSRLFELGWRPKVSLTEGLRCMYEHHFKKNLLEVTN
jgi:GDP-L-fucose synthase